MPGHYHYGPVNADITATSVTASDTAAKVCRFPIMRSIGSKSIYIHYAFDRATTRRLPYTKCGRTFKMKDTLIQYQGEAHAGLDYLWLLDSGTISGFPTTFEADLTERIHNIHASRGRVANEEGKWDYPWPSYSRIFLRLQSPMRCAYGH